MTNGKLPPCSAPAPNKGLEREVQWHAGLSASADMRLIYKVKAFGIRSQSRAKRHTCIRRDLMHSRGLQLHDVVSVSVIFTCLFCCFYLFFCRCEVVFLSAVLTTNYEKEKKTIKDTIHTNSCTPDVVLAVIVVVGVRAKQKEATQK